MTADLDGCLSRSGGYRLPLLPSYTGMENTRRPVVGRSGRGTLRSLLPPASRRRWPAGRETTGKSELCGGRSSTGVVAVVVVMVVVVVMSDEQSVHVSPRPQPTHSRTNPTRYRDDKKIMYLRTTTRRNTLTLSTNHYYTYYLIRIYWSCPELQF